MWEWRASSSICSLIPGFGELVQLRDYQTFSVKDLTVYIFGFAGHSASVLTIQLCHYSIRETTDIYVNKWTWLCSNKTLRTDTESWISCKFHMLYFSSLFVPQPFEHVDLLAVGKQAAGQTWPIRHSGPVPAPAYKDGFSPLHPHPIPVNHGLILPSVLFEVFFWPTSLWIMKRDR